MKKKNASCHLDISGYYCILLWICGGQLPPLSPSPQVTLRVINRESVMRLKPDDAQFHSWLVPVILRRATGFHSIFPHIHIKLWIWAELDFLISRCGFSPPETLLHTSFAVKELSITLFNSSLFS